MSDAVHPDLKWLAENVDMWPIDGAGYIQKTLGGRTCSTSPSMLVSSKPSFSKAEWQSARQQIEDDRMGRIMQNDKDGLHYDAVMTQEEESMTADEYQGKYSAYHKDVRHLKTIDVYRTVDLFGCEAHGHAISHAAKKLLLTGSRTGGKSVEQDVSEAIDSLQRWMEMREEDRLAKELEQ